ncbi:MAG: CHRD domain-containing protein [Candidatus Dormibacteria bacterium]
MRVLTVTAPIAACLTLAACQGQVSTKPSPTPAPAHESTTIALRHVPSGTAEVSFDSAGSGLQVHIALTGLAPNTAHPADLKRGACGSGGVPIVSLGDVRSDEHGNADVTSPLGTLKVLPRGASIDVHVGPDVNSTTGAPSIACGDLVGTGAPQKPGANSSTASPRPSSGATASPSAGSSSSPGTSTTSTTDEQPAIAFAEFYSAPAAGRAPVGLATLESDGAAKTLTVTVHMAGLAPGSHHPNHVHLGSCESQGKVLYGLSDLVADDFGNASASTTVKDVSAIAFGAWYVNVHQGPALGDQAGFTPVACGDVVRTTQAAATASPSASVEPTETPSATQSSSPTPATRPTSSPSPVASPSPRPTASPTR